ncbi:BTAD domain-containing putative transcriptional regulator [Kitasatospora sp. NPDC051853]|uniref:AfsR/SARP family transcriptional regulator n=1 Tax=Kitasatospora sp. NPDC051853 TaxID=3364058 RepID=UPI0037AF82F5
MAVGLGILGPLQVLADGRPVDPGPRKQQIMLAALLCHANTRVSADELAEALWGDAPPRTARKNLQVYVCALRRLLGAGSETRIGHQSGGYVLHTVAEEFDVLGFEQRAWTGAPAAALELWRGPVLDGLRDVPLIDTVAQRLDQRVLVVFEDWVEAALATGGGASAVARVSEVAQRHPFRERLRMLQMNALSQAGRRSEALAVYDELRQALAHELGLPPSPALERCYRSLLEAQATEGPWPVTGGQGGQGRQGREGREGREVGPNLLPCDPLTFTGREAAARELTGVLVGGEGRLAVVSGPLGAGKTALAAHVAHRLGERFPDGRLFVRLRGEDGRARPVEDVLRQLLAAVAPDRAASADPRWEWQLWLTGRRALLVVDDARCESEVRPLLPEAGESAVLVTARPGLIGLEGAHRLWLGAFEPAEAVEFLGRVIGAARVDADREAAGRIVRSAGLLPLGVRLVADRLAFLRHVPLGEYAARLAGGRGLLDELCGADPAVRARLAESLRHLPEAWRRTALRLGLCEERVFTPDQAAAVLGSDPGTAVRVLERLLEEALVAVAQPEEGGEGGTGLRYEMPALLHAYARETVGGPVGPRPTGYPVTGYQDYGSEVDLTLFEPVP